MESGRRAARVELAVAVDGLAGRKRLDLDTPLPHSCSSVSGSGRMCPYAPVPTS